MNPFQRLGVKISNWWRGEPQDSGGVVTLNSPSFLERIFHNGGDEIGNRHESR